LRLSLRSSDDQRIDAFHKLGVAVRLAASCGKKIEVAIGTRDKPVHARADKNRSSHASVLLFATEISSAAIEGSANKKAAQRYRCAALS
jgi:hypothetical protein